MNRLQELRYQTAKQQFHEQMDQTDLARSFFVTPAGYVVGFSIMRADGKTLEYDAAENKYSCLDRDEPSRLDIRPEDGILDLPPYDYLITQKGNVTIHETHVFPDPSTNGLYESLRLLREEYDDQQFSIALAMTELLSCELDDNELAVMANKAVHAQMNSLQTYQLKEITAAINDLMVNGLTDHPVSEFLGNYDGPTVKKALLSADEKSFCYLIGYTAEENRDIQYPGSIFYMESPSALKETMDKILSYLESANHELQDPKASPLDNRIQTAKDRAGGSAAPATHEKNQTSSR